MSDMKIAVMNFSGNAGKSTVARHLLAPRMGNAPIIPVETINSDETDEAKVDAISGKEFDELIETISLLDSVVVDVGASNVETFINKMSQYRGSHEDFDLFVIPTVPKTKQIRDTISTIETLREMGVPANKIRVVFNMIEYDQDIERVFSSLFLYQSKYKSFVLDKNAVIHVSDLFGKLRDGDTILGILSDDTDLKAELRNAATSEEKVAISRQIANKRLAIGVAEELNAVFSIIAKQ